MFNPLKDDFIGFLFYSCCSVLTEKAEFDVRAKQLTPIVRTLS